MMVRGNAIIETATKLIIIVESDKDLSDKDQRTIRYGGFLIVLGPYAPHEGGQAGTESTAVTVSPGATRACGRTHARARCPRMGPLR